MSKYVKYPGYRDSGVEWLGEIPEDWKTPKLKLFIMTTKGFAFKSDNFIESGVPVVKMSEIKNGTINESSVFLPREFQLSHKQVLLKYKDIIVSTVGSAPEVKNSAVGQIGIVPQSHDGSLLNQNTVIFSPDKKLLSNDYLPYILKSQAYREHLDLHAHGTANQASLNLSDMLKFVFPFPTYQEQQTIANYLDIATAKIDTLIEKQTKLISLLKEKRQAVISTAVTRGLDSTVAMKDSGVEWLGEIPEGWEVKKLKFIAYAKPSNVDKKSKDDEKAVLLCNYTDVYYNDFITNEIDFMKATATDEQIKKFTLEVDDVIITKDSEGPEDIAVATCIQEVQDNLVCGYHLTHIKPRKCNGRYLFRAFNSDGIHDQFKVAANGITRYGIGVYGIDNAWFPLPPMQEQIAISEYIDAKTLKIDSLIGKSTKSINLLKEKRTALISSAVTGKVDVREIA